MKLSQFETLEFASTGGYTNEYQEVATTSVNLLPYGISTISYSTSANQYTLGAPIAGVEKVIVLNSTKVSDSTSINTRVYTGSTDISIVSNTTTYKDSLYINVQPPYALAKLIGLSTSKWGVVGAYGAVQFSTANTYTS